MLKRLLCSLPLPVKLTANRLLFALDGKKRAALSTLEDVPARSDFPRVNERPFKADMKERLVTFGGSASYVEQYIHALYHDRLTLMDEGRMDETLPAIICVVKNEADKLRAFFDHYDRLGRVNYLFIDNGSTDESVAMMKAHNARIYTTDEAFSTVRKSAWIELVYTTLPEGMWTILLDADELLVYDGYEQLPLNELLAAFDRHGMDTAGAVMIDMFSPTQPASANYMDDYVWFENNFHEEKSFLFNSIYGGIREREFNFTDSRAFLIKKYPVAKKDSRSVLANPHTVWPYERNFRADTWFGLLHYKLFDRELEKYRRIAREGSYHHGSTEYKMYLQAFAQKSYEDIFRTGPDSVHYEGTPSLRKIACLKDAEKLAER